MPLTWIMVHGSQEHILHSSPNIKENNEVFTGLDRLNIQKNIAPLAQFIIFLSIYLCIVHTLHAYSNSQIVMLNF